MGEVWVVYNVDYGDPVAAYFDGIEAEKAAVGEHNRLYGHNEDYEPLVTYEELMDADSYVTVIGPVNVKG
jgi:hypothetical protein